MHYLDLVPGLQQGYLLKRKKKNYEQCCKMNQRVIQALCMQHTILEFNNCWRSSFTLFLFFLLSWRQGAGKVEGSSDVQTTETGLCVGHRLFV